MKKKEALQLEKVLSGLGIVGLCCGVQLVLQATGMTETCSQVATAPLGLSQYECIGEISERMLLPSLSGAHRCSRTNLNIPNVQSLS